MMKIKIGTPKEPEWTEIDVHYREAIIQNCFNGIGIETDQGLFGISQRDSGIEVMLDGKLVWSSMALIETPHPRRKAATMITKNKFKVGDKVDYHSIIGGPITSKGHTIQIIDYIPSSKEPVVWISGKSGCVAIKALSIAEK